MCVCAYIYVMYKRLLRYQAPLNHTPPYKCNCSSTLGTALGYTCSIIGKAGVDSQHTGSQE